MQLSGITALITILSHLFFISLAFWCLQNLHPEKYISMKEMPGKLLIVLLSVGLGFLCSTFFLSFINSAHELVFLFQ